MSYRLGRSYPSMAGYFQGQGHMHYGPGTSMVQFTKPVFGMGGCRCGDGNIRCGCQAGLGLFDSGTDFTGWGWQEWFVIGIGGYVLFSTIFTTGRAVRKVKALPGERRKRRAARLRKEASELTKKKGLF